MNEHVINFKETLIAPVRTMAGLKPPQDGHPPELYTDNGNESINGKVKSWVEHSKSTWPEFTRKLQTLVDNQYLEAEKSIYGAGEYVLADCCQHLEVQSLRSKDYSKALGKCRAH